MSRPLRIALIAVAALLIVVVGGAAVLIASFDLNTYKPQIIEAVKRATGRDLALNGKISLKPSLWPTIQMADVDLSNPPGFSRPRMATLRSLELQLALLPLLSSRVEIDRLVLIQPDVLLETDKAGHPNWQLTPPASPSPATAQAPAQPGRAAPAISVDAVRIEDGTFAYRDDATGKTMTLAVPRLDATSASPDSPLHVDAAASYDGTPFHVVADTGSLTRLQDQAATSPWPVRLTLTAAGATLAADGSLTQPIKGKGYTLAVNGSVPDAAALTPLLGGFVPPPLHDVSFAAKVADRGGAFPEVSSLSLHVGASDLSAQVPGLTLARLDVAAAAANQPLKADASGRLGDQPLTLAATTGPLALLMPGAKPSPFPVDLALQAAGATLSAKGTLADARAMTGANIVLAAQIPDLSGLSPLARHPLPAVKQIAFQGTVTDAAGGFRNGAVLRGLGLTSAAGDLSGNAAIGLGARPSLTAALKSNRIDLDALQAAAEQAPAAQPASPPAAKPLPKPSGRLFSEQPIPFGLLQAADADVKLDVADLHSGGNDYKAITTHAVLKDGKLAVEPFAADLPGGHLTGALSVDATRPAPPVHLMLHAPGLALKTILAAAHEPSFASGNLEVYADLHGSGDSPHAIASTLDGSLGLAMAGGSIDNRLLGSILGKVMESLNALNLVGKGGTSELRCFGMRLDARHGIGTFKALTLSSALLTMTGGGQINLGDETLAMRLRPQARVAGTGLVIPIEVSGPIRNPAVKVNEIGAAESNAGTVAGAILGNATPLGIVGGLLGADKVLSGGSADICTPALAAARGQAVAEAAPTASAAPGTKPAAPNPGAILKNLFR